MARACGTCKSLDAATPNASRGRAADPAIASQAAEQGIWQALSCALNTPGHGRATSRARLQCENFWQGVLLQRLLYLRPARSPVRIDYWAHEA